MAAERDTNGSLIIIGASYAKGWNPGTLLELDVVNKGVGGEETRFTRQRFEEDVLRSGAEAVLIWGFINDVFRADRAVVDERLEQTRRDLAWMAESASDAGLAVILATEVTIREPAGFTNWIKSVIGGLLGRSSYQDYINGHVRAVNEWLRRYARERDIALVDFEAALSNETGARRSAYATPDGSHITPAGYQALNTYFRENMSRGAVFGASTRD